MDRRISQALVTATLLATAVFSSAAAADDGLRSQVIEPDTVIGGKTYGEWSAAWWQWAASIPVSSHPLVDNGSCTVGQTGQVFFLGGKFCANNTNCNTSAVSRRCTVPGGKNLFFPIVNSVDSPPDPPRTTINEFRKVVQDIIDGAVSLEVDLDGQSLKDKDLIAFRIQSSAFDITLPNDNLFNVAAGTYFPAVDDGVYVMLEPLSAGSHLLHFTGRIPAFNFTLDITYYLTVSR
jgi:hypothetical protein